jgi:hypothetical protein
LLPAGAFAGWGLHPLESAAFSRRTQIPVIRLRLAERVISTDPGTEGMRQKRSSAPKDP